MEDSFNVISKNEQLIENLMALLLSSHISNSLKLYMIDSALIFCEAQILTLLLSILYHIEK